MKDEINNLKMGSGSTVCSEASTRMGLKSSTLLDHHHFLLSGMKLSF